eukprot:gene7008-9597_t
MELRLSAKTVRIDSQRDVHSCVSIHLKSNASDTSFPVLTIKAENGVTLLFGEVRTISKDADSNAAILVVINKQKVYIEMQNPKEATVLFAALANSENSTEFSSSRDIGAVTEYFKSSQSAVLVLRSHSSAAEYDVATYRSAILQNFTDFKDKVVLDVGAGSGLLSFFAAQAGARKVYAVEGSAMAEAARKLIQNNGLSDIITVIQGKIEEIEIPEPVDAIVSEPLGIMLVNERMLESYVYSRRWLKPGGKMFPTQSQLFICPFSDASVFLETQQKASFWQTKDFHGIDLSTLHEDAQHEYFSQPCVEQVNPECLVGTPTYKIFNYMTMNVADLFEITMDFSYTFINPVEIHGIASWFDNTFQGSSFSVPLSTSPFAPLTHWYQVRCLLQNSIFVQPGEQLQGTIHMRINRHQSYDVRIIASTSTQTAKGHINLKEPNFRFGQISFVPTAMPISQSVGNLQQHRILALRLQDASSSFHCSINKT